VHFRIVHTVYNLDYLLPVTVSQDFVNNIILTSRRKSREVSLMLDVPHRKWEMVSLYSVLVFKQTQDFISVIHKWFGSSY